MTEQMGEDPRTLDRRRFLKRAALGVADALETAARLVGAPGLDSGTPARRRTGFDQPEDGAEDPMFMPARRPGTSDEEQRRKESSADPGETA